MSRSTVARPPLKLDAPWFAGAMVLALAVGAGLFLTQIMMAPPAAELRRMALYLTLAGAATLVSGSLALRLIAGAANRSLRARIFAGALTGTVIALINVLVVAELMFVSTSHDLRLLLALTVFAGLITVGFSTWVATTLTRRITTVAEGVRTLAQGRYEETVNVRGEDEVARLAHDVNVLGERLLAADRQRQQIDGERRDLTASISHDLRTPLASMRAMIDALEDGVVADAGEVARYYGTLRREVDRLSRMIDDLFELSRIDSGAMKLDCRPVAVQDIAGEVVDAMQAIAQRKGVHLSLTPGDAEPAAVDGARVERAVTNLVQNSLDHTDVGGLIDVRVRGFNGFIEVQVADTGHGIASEDLPHVWDRFYRSDRARSGADDGGRAGLGLAIVRGIAEAHGGTVEVQSSPGAGSRFVIRLPRATDRREA